MENGNNSSKMSPSNSANSGEKLKGSNQSSNAVKLDPDDSYDVDSSSDDDICELEHLRKLFVGGLTPYTTEETLKTFYEQWGKVVDVVVMRDIASRRSRGFGFVTYTKAYMVDKAQDARPHMIDGKTVEAKRALPRPEREKREPNISVKKLFVGGLKDNHDEECLKEYFSQFGNVISVKILTDKTTGKRRGFAFIEYDDYDAVDKAILKKTHSIKYVVVDVKKSVYNQEQQRKNSAAANNPAAPNMSGPNMGGPPPPGYGPPPGPGMPPYQYPPPMNTAPPNMNYWGQGPPQQPPQNYGGGYQPKNAFYQQPPPPQPGNWNYPSMPPNTWGTAAPPPPCPPPGPVNWQQGPPAQWSGGPPPGTVPGGVSGGGGGGAAPPPNWNNAPPSAPPSGPPVAPPAVPPQAPNFGAGYQQNYGGGPTKNSTANANRMNPYCPPPHFGNQNPQSGNHNFNNYNGGPPTGPPGVGPTGPPPVNNASSGPKPVPPVNNANRRY